MSNEWKDPRAGGDADGQPSPAIVNFPGCAADELPADFGDPDLTARHGEPVYFGITKEGMPFVNRINEAYWAARFAKDREVIFDPAEGVFYQYDGKTGLFSVVSPDAVKQTVSENMLEFARSDDAFAGLEKLRTDRTLTAVVSQLRGIAERRGAFERRPQAIHFSNLMLHFLRRDWHVPTYFNSRYCSRNQLPIPYDSEAECPRFLNELLGPALGTSDIGVLQKLGGQCLMGRNLVQRFLIMTGVAGGGKTQVANVIRSVVGNHNTAQLRTAHLGDRFETARFIGRTLLVGSDVGSDFLSQRGAEVIKALVGGDYLDAERKGENGVFRLKGEFNLIITANARLKVRLREDVGAWRRRMILVRFDGEPPKRKIPNFAELLVKEEGPGIVNWFVKGLEMLLADIDETGDIRLPEEQLTRVDALLAESDSLRIFIRERLRADSQSDLTVSEITGEYAAFCLSKSWNPLPEHQIQRLLKGVMLEDFQKAQSHDCQRDGKPLRGFRDVAFVR